MISTLFTPLNRITFLSPKLFWQYMCWYNYTRFSHPWPVVASIR